MIRVTHRSKAFLFGLDATRNWTVSMGSRQWGFNTKLEAMALYWSLVSKTNQGVK